MTEETKQGLPKLNWNDKEYDQDKLTDMQKYLFAQLLDVQKKENQAKFAMDQILAMKEVFTSKLEKEMTSQMTANLEAHEREFKLFREMMESKFKAIEARLWRLEAMIMGSTLIILTLAATVFMKM